jgi:hypothetical protein
MEFMVRCIRIVGTTGSVAQAYNPSNLEGRDQKDHSLRSALAKSLQDIISTNG